MVLVYEEVCFMFPLSSIALTSAIMMVGALLLLSEIFLAPQEEKAVG